MSGLKHIKRKVFYLIRIFAAELEFEYENINKEAQFRLI